jgi:predicted secreted protein
VLANTIVQNANEAFVSGMVRATLIAAIVMAVASVVTFVILPARVRHAEEEEPDSTEKAPSAEGG